MFRQMWGCAAGKIEGKVSVHSPFISDIASTSCIMRNIYMSFFLHTVLIDTIIVNHYPTVNCNSEFP